METTERTSITVPKTTRDRLASMAAALGITQGRAVDMLLDEGGDAVARALQEERAKSLKTLKKGGGG